MPKIGVNENSGTATLFSIDLCPAVPSTKPGAEVMIDLSDGTIMLLKASRASSD